MRIHRYLPAIVLLFAASICRAEDFRFVHVSDIHVGAGNNVETDTKMLAEINALVPVPAFVAGTGDLCETGTPSQYADYRKIAAGLSIPSYQAPGNHDVRWNPLGKEGFVEGSGQPMHQSWSYGGVHFVLLDSTTLLQHWGHFDFDMLDWLRKDLAAWGTEKPVIIGFHHPIAHGGAVIDNEDDLLELVAPYNVRLWLQGHGHSNVMWNVNGAPATMVAGLYQGSYDIVDIKGDTLTITRRAIPGVKKGQEMLTSKPTVKITEILTVSLKKQVAPRWRVRVEGNERVVVERGDLPGDAKMAMRIDGSEYQPMTDAGAGWASAIDAPLAGEHRITVQTTLKDGRQYQMPVSAITTKDGTPQFAWQMPTGAAVMSRLVRDGDMLYVPSMGGDLIAMNPVTGKENWRFKTNGNIFSTPQVDSGVVYFGSADHNIYAVDARTGQKKWQCPTGSAVFGGASVAKGIVCIASCDKTIYGIDVQTGRPKWTVKTGGMTQSKVATDGNLFFVGTWDNTFRALKAETGDEAWSKKFGKSRAGGYSFYYAPAIGSPCVAEGKVYVSSNDGLLHAVDIASGEIAWETPESHQLGYCGPLYHDGRIFQGSLNGNVYCFDAKSGKDIWKASTGSAIYDSSAAFGEGKVFIGCVNGTFNAIDAASGKMTWQYRLGPGHVLASPTTDEQNVYISSMSGKVTALPLR